MSAFSPDEFAAAKADGVREAADNLWLSSEGQVNEHVKAWLHRRANLIDPRTRDTVCEHGNPLAADCIHCPDWITHPNTTPEENTHP